MGGSEAVCCRASRTDEAGRDVDNEERGEAGIAEDDSWTTAGGGVEVRRTRDDDACGAAKSKDVVGAMAA